MKIIALLIVIFNIIAAVVGFLIFTNDLSSDYTKILFGAFAFFNAACIPKSIKKLVDL